MPSADDHEKAVDKRGELTRKKADAGQLSRNARRKPTPNAGRAKAASAAVLARS
jgi:hypothetical protein